MFNRDNSIDALRGFAILTMILSGSIAYSDAMPAWMFHAQVPPPLHKFNPAIPGITWVDLVFPFFLFSMGAAIPLALKKHIEQQKSFLHIAVLALKRMLLLTFFALFTNHMKAWVINTNPGVQEQLLSLLAFILLFFQFYENKKEKYKWVFLILKIASFITAVLLLWKLPFWNSKGFDFYKSDIIIMLLGNMAFFATIIYYFTKENQLLRLGLLAFVMGVFLSAKEPTNSWTKELFNFNHIGILKFDWMYKFYFLKYLFIVLPGTLAGDWILQNSSTDKKIQHKEISSLLENVIAALCLLLIAINLYCLFTRHLLLNFILTALVCLLLFVITMPTSKDFLLKKLTNTGTYFLLLGLVFEAYEGGIKKDVSTYSYYFVTVGLAFLLLTAFNILDRSKICSFITKYLSLNGKNPMVAYVAGNLVVLPILSLTTTKTYWDAMNQNFLMGCLKGILFTSIVSVITIFFVKKKWFWKT